MKKSILKKAAGLAMAAVLAVSMVLPAAAQTPETGLEVRTEMIDGREYQILTGTEDQVKAEMRYFSSVLASVDPQSGKINLGATFIAKSNIPVNFTVSVQRSTNNSSWSDVLGQSWTQTFQATAYLVQPMYRTYNNPVKNYFYRTGAYAEYRVNGVLFEGVQVYSPGAYYSNTRAASNAEEPFYEVYRLIK